MNSQELLREERQFIKWSRNENLSVITFVHKEVKKNSQLEKFSKTRGNWPMEFPGKAKAGNSQNVSFPENRMEIPFESILKVFMLDSGNQFSDGVTSY